MKKLNNLSGEDIFNLTQSDGRSDASYQTPADDRLDHGSSVQLNNCDTRVDGVTDTICRDMRVVQYILV